MSTSWLIVVRVLLSLACGALVGFEREVTDHPAGIRTHILVTVGACVFTCLSLFGFKGFLYGDRVAASIVTGIGFIGGGAILKSKGGWVTGLTTAASLWSCAAIGMLFGTGYYVVGFVVTSLDLFVLELLDWMIDKVSPRMKTRTVPVTVAGSYQDDIIKGVVDVLEKSRCHPRLLEFHRLDHGSKVDLELVTRLQQRADLQGLTSELFEVQGVTEVHWG